MCWHGGCQEILSEDSSIEPRLDSAIAEALLIGGINKVDEKKKMGKTALRTVQSYTLQCQDEKCQWDCHSPWYSKFFHSELVASILCS